jgi:uncharacterized protein (TIGR00251 family)
MGIWDGADLILAVVPFVAVADGLRIRVRLVPKAARDRVQAVVRDADGTAALKVAVTAPPEKGKANAALLKMLARAWRVPKSDLTLIAGHRDRRKVVHLAGDPVRLGAALTDWLAGIAKNDGLG